jgi:SAM-dependent methyltransferase
MLPPLNGRRVLDLGSGFGAFCRWAVEQGAAEVTGVDLSANMIASARERGPGLPTRYIAADLEAYEPEAGAFDLVYSSLALHYLADFDAACRRIADALVPGGSLVFSMEHPIYAARANPEWLADGAGQRVFALSGYGREGERVTDWVVSGVVKHHRKLSTCVGTLLRHGLVLDAMDEWTPSAADLAAHAGLDDEIIRPMLLLMALHKPVSQPN